MRRNILVFAEDFLQVNVEQYHNQKNIFFQGYLLGNPSTFEGENNYEIPFAYGMGLISDELYEVGFSLGVIFVHSD